MTKGCTDCGYFYLDECEVYEDGICRRDRDENGIVENKCDKCENNGVVGACRGRYDTGMNWVCNFYPKNGSATITIHNTFVEANPSEETD